VKPLVTRRFVSVYEVQCEVSSSSACGEVWLEEREAELVENIFRLVAWREQALQAFGTRLERRLEAAKERGASTVENTHRSLGT
jgi:hypothetical protein